MEQKWYELSKKDLMSYINDTCSLKEFFEWWQDGDFERFMELRFTDWRDSDAVSRRYKLFKYKTSVFVKNAYHLEQVVKNYSGKTNIWFGVNPKRPLREPDGRFKIKQYDVHCKEIAFLFLDIDRVVKSGRPATNNELMHADILCDKIVENMSKNNMASSYVKLCSGNGVQVLFKLDVPFTIPKPTYDDEGKKHVENSFFKERKNIIRKGIGSVLSNFSFESVEGVVEVDSTCFNMGRVGALHKTFNFKYDTPLPRGIVSFVDIAKNDGLSDYLKSIKEKKTVHKSFKKSLSSFDKSLGQIFTIKEHDIVTNKLVKFMLEHTFPAGGINNTLWFALKLSFYISGICNEDSSYVDVHERLKTLHDRGFSDNGLEKDSVQKGIGPLSDNDGKMIPYVVNKYLRMNKVCKVGSSKTFYSAPLYEVAPFGRSKHDITLNLKPQNLNSDSAVLFTLNKNTKGDFIDDLKLFAEECYKIRQGEYLEDNYFEQGEITTIGVVFIQDQLFRTGVSFLKSFRDKWGDELTAYMMKYYLDCYVNYKRWS